MPTASTTWSKRRRHFGSAGIFVVVIFALFSRFGGVYSAAAALLGGIVTWIVGMQLDFPYLLSLAVAFSGYVLTASWEMARFYS
ncbi:hypothetical protein [Methylomarinum vadi]|uniref:hypothetical protein n=1 Tax=Methylomarinum vadi TaxID=438855 RepID=UPI001F1D001C|nr:hypothetical protein [Methylomarinum vadi]